MKRVAAALTAAAAAGLGAAYGIYHLAFFQRPKLDIPTAEEWAQGSRFLPQIRENVEFVDSLPCDYVHITADDGTSLSARYCHETDDAPIAIIMHGYRATAMRDTMGLIVLCKKLGYNLLMPDQRAHGRSDSDTITMGAQERYDARAWAYWASVRSSGKVPIFLMGVSMGAATVLLAAGLNLPDNVCGIVADCGYTSPREITRKCLPEYLPGMPLELTYAVGRLGAILFGHFDPEAADCEAAAAQSKVPILFVHGDADGFVPYDMGKRNYEACRAKGKKFLTVHGAEHAVSYYHDNDAYTKQATEFLQDCLARRGFVWPPETDEPEK